MPSPTTSQRKRQRRRSLPQQPPPPHHRIVLLFDLDAFYAQTERVRLGLGLDASVALLQWNSVLAVTYPAREYGIQRGDSWEAVNSKSNHQCLAIHLPIIPITSDDDSKTNDNTTTTVTMEEGHDNAAENSGAATEANNSNNNNVDDDWDEEFQRVFRLSPTEQEQCRQNENGVRRHHSQGKASLERYRLASRVIFKNVVESLKRRLQRGFLLEKASIDEFYLDITDFCYSNGTAEDCDGDNDDDGFEKTRVIGESQQQLGHVLDMEDSVDDVDIALRRACHISACIRNDVWKNLGFTMSAGISTNKMMAKLAASFGKPNGQAVLHPRNFDKFMAETKVRKVRNFGGKLGKQVLSLMHSQNGTDQRFEDFATSATMHDLAQIPLPVLQNAFSADTAQFVFQACQGIDHELVRETSGALVKSITAFKSFVSSKNQSEVYNWLKLLANEIVDRVEQDAARNHRYPKTCALNYTYSSASSDGKRPRDNSSTARSHVQTRSYRLTFPAERETQSKKSQSLVDQAMARLSPILKEHPLRGVGISASNFKSRGHPPDGNASIESFFSVTFQKNCTTPMGKDSSIPSAPNRERNTTSASNKRLRADLKPIFAQTGNEAQENQYRSITNASDPDSLVRDRCRQDSTASPNLSTEVTDADYEMARKLQAAFDRENYVFSSVKRQKGEPKSSKPQTKKIDAFFTKR